MASNESELELGPAHDDPQRAVTDESLHVVRGIRKAFLSICRCGNILFSQHKITTDQYALMFAIQRSPGICNADVAEQIYAEPHTVTAMIALLERRGLLYRTPNPSDGRVRHLYLSDEAELLMKQLASYWDGVGAVLLECLSRPEGPQALKFLEAVSSEMTRKREDLSRDCSE